MPDRNLVTMYGTEAMNSSIQHHNHQIEDNEEEDDVPSGGESIDNPQIRYEAAAHALQNGGAVGPPTNGMDAMNGNGVDSINVAPQQHPIYVPGSEIVPAAGGGGADQLTLSFQGEVYVFDAVSPEKVRFLFKFCYLKSSVNHLAEVY